MGDSVPSVMSTTSASVPSGVMTAPYGEPPSVTDSSGAVAGAPELVITAIPWQFPAATGPLHGL
jgi:hypothetical protein